MTDALTIVGLGGSRAKGSKSRAALVAALEGVANAGAKTELLDIRELDLPMYVQHRKTECDEAAERVAAVA